MGLMSHLPQGRLSPLKNVSLLAVVRLPLSTIAVRLDAVWKPVHCVYIRAYNHKVFEDSSCILPKETQKAIGLNGFNGALPPNTTLIEVIMH